MIMTQVNVDINFKEFERFVMRARGEERARRVNLPAPRAARELSLGQSILRICRNCRLFCAYYEFKNI